MDTNSNIPAEKKVVSVEILYLDELGYGPQGKHTRKKWREECLENLLAGKEQFLAWQKSWEGMIDDSIPRVSFEYRLNDGDTSSGNYMESYSYFYQQHPYDLDFSGHHFESLISLISIEFLHNALFSGARFSSFSYFKDIKFTKAANFADAIFNGGALFDSVIFDNFVYFNHSKFNSVAIFNTVIFSNVAIFKNTIFKDTLVFGQSTFQKRVHFGGAIFENECGFNNSNFEDSTNFESAIFKNVGHFEKANFLKMTPSFRGCKIGDTRLEFSDNSYFPQDEKSEDAIKNISFLKRLSEEHGQTDQALNFNAMELRAKRLQSEPKPASWSFKTITWLYEKIADYGRSFIRPLFAYLGLISITYLLALIAAANNSPQDCKGELWRVFSDWRNNGYPSCISYELPDDKFKLNGYRAAFEYTTYRAAGILDFSDNDKQTVAVARRLFNADVEPTWMRFWGIFKAIASTALLFLAALGLRNKYRIK